MKVTLPITDGSNKFLDLIRSPRSYKPKHVNVITVSPIPSGTTINAGTLTVTCQAPGSETFEAFDDNVIDLSEPLRLEVHGRIADIDFVLAGVSGTTEAIQVTVDSYDAAEC